MKKIVLNSITFYTKYFSPLLHQLLGIKTACRSFPSCSEYAKHVIKEKGIIKGLFLATRRVINCQPVFSI